MDRLLRLAWLVPLMAYRFGGRARINALASAVIKASAHEDRTGDQGRYQQENPASLQNDLPGQHRLEREGYDPSQ